jgi:WD40 repeat protein
LRTACAPRLTQRFGSADLSLSEVETVALRVWQSDDPFELLQRRGVQGILEDYLGESLDALSPDLRAAAVALLAQMVTSAGTRNVISAEDLVQRVREQDAQVSPDLLAEALDRLESESRLIRRERRHDIYLYEITSEFLVPWINERRQEAHVERERRSDELRREHERLRERRRLRVLGSIAAAMLIFATVVTILALWALSQRTTARNKEAQATSLALTSSSTPLLGSRPDLSLLLAYAGYRAAPLTEARSGVMAALMAVRGTGGESVGILRGGDRGFAGVAFSPDGRELAAASDDGAVRVFDARTNRQLGAALANSTSVFSSAAFSPDGRTIASAHDDGVRLWDARTHKQLATIAPGGSRGSVTGVAFSPDGRTLAFSSSDGVIRLVIARTHRLLRAQLRNDKRASSSKTATAGFSGLAFGPDETLASAGDDGTVRLWDARTHQQRGAPLGHSRNPILGVAFSADGRMLASAGNDGTVRLWSPRTHKQLGSSLVGDRHVVNAVAFSPDGQTLASAGGGGAVWLWDTRTRRQLGLPLGGHKGAVRSVAFSPDGRTLASASADETIRSWDLRVHDLGSVLRGHTTAVNSLAFSRNGRMLASAGEDQTIAVWDTRTHEPLGTPSRLQPGSRPLLPGLRAGGLAFSPDGRILASAINARTIRLRDVQTRKPLGAPLRGHKDLIDSLAFSPDGHTLASAGGDQTIRLWDTRTHRQLGVPFPAVGGPVHSLALSADGLALALVGVDGTIGLWDIRTRKRQGAPFGVVGGFVTSLSFSPDGHKLAASVSDGTIRLWETRTHKQAGAPLRGHGDGLIAFTPDGRTLASAGSGRSIRLWDTRTHKELGKALRGHTSFVASLAFSPDGRSLASASLDRTVRLWKDILWTSDAELQTTVCHLVGKDLTGAEWGQYASGIARRRSCP